VYWFFFDDILVYNKSYHDHLLHLEQVFQLLQQHQWRVKLSKCAFAQREISYFGYTISGQGVSSTSPAKIQTVVDWPSPQPVKELKSFLGLAGYYRKFVKHFGVISRPLTCLPGYYRKFVKHFGVISRPLIDLLKKNTLFVSTSAHEEAF
jgi:hypothetical protein